MNKIFIMVCLLQFQLSNCIIAQFDEISYVTHLFKEKDVMNKTYDTLNNKIVILDSIILDVKYQLEMVLNDSLMTSDSLQIHLNNLKGPLRKVSNLAIMTESKIKDDIYLNGLRIYDIIEDKGWLKVYGYKYWDDLVIEYEELLDLAERKKFDINDKLNIVKAKLSNCHDIMMKLFKRLRNQ